MMQISSCRKHRNDPLGARHLPIILPHRCPEAPLQHFPCLPSPRSSGPFGLLRPGPDDQASQGLCPLTLVSAGAHMPHPSSLVLLNPPHTAARLATFLRNSRTSCRFAPGSHLASVSFSLSFIYLGMR